MTWVKKIILLNLIVFGICQISSIFGFYFENILALFPIYSSDFSIHQLVTHLFVHADTTHLFFNMLFFLIVGPEVEELFKNKFLSFYLLAGIFSSGLYCLGSNSGIIGASGAVYATISVSIINGFSKINLKEIFIQKFVNLIQFRNIFFLTLIIVELYYCFVNSNDHIGHLAHIFGVFFGLIFYWKFKFAHPQTNYDN
jgi:membrane associated rhomboid family serine protease